MRSPWLDIPLGDYEGHMALPGVAQAALLADVLAEVLALRAPDSLALLGCAGGNGLERVDSRITPRVVAVDINERYVHAAHARFAARFPAFSAIAADLEIDSLDIEPVALVYAALLFEYVDVPRTLARIRPLVRDGGALVTLVQEPSADIPDVTPTPFATLLTLSPAMRLVTPDDLRAHAARVSLAEAGASRRSTSAGKTFTVQVFVPAEDPCR